MVNMAKAVSMGICVFCLGCTQSGTLPDGTTKASQVSNSDYLLQVEPAEAMPVGQARTHVEDGARVTVLGIIGGSNVPFVEGLAAFTIVDPSVPYCAADEGCPTPWDYCCTQDEVADNIATVKLIDDAGRPVSHSARELLGVQELSTVVVSGVANRDAQGNLSVAAREVFVRP